jgi:hypothetical protein
MRLLVPIAATLLCAAGCTSGEVSGEKAPGAPPSAPGGNAPAMTPQQEEAMQKADDAAYQLEIATTRLERAKMDAEQQQVDAALAVAKAKIELALATKARDHYLNVEMPAKRARAELELTQVKDNLTDQEEELTQLELMYKGDDLGDKTKEIVIARTKRRLERMRASVALQTKDLDDLVNVQQPEQREKLENAVKDKEADLQRADANAKSGAIDKQLAIKTQTMELEKQKREFVKAKKAAAQP